MTASVQPLLPTNESVPTNPNRLLMYVLISLHVRSPLPRCPLLLPRAR